MRLLLDENIPKDIQKNLHGHHIPIKHLLRTKYAASNDEVIFNYAVHNKLTIVTYDNDFVSDKFISQPHYGIIFLRTRSKEFKFIAAQILSVIKNHKSLKDKVIIVD